MDEKKVREAIDELKSLICVRKRTLAALPTSARKDSLYNNEITALETAIEALEKQLPKKVENRTEYRNLYGHLIFYKGFCPSCGRVVESYRNNSCHICTQRLDWSE